MTARRSAGPALALASLLLGPAHGIAATPRWADYQVILWAADSVASATRSERFPVLVSRLRELGITGVSLDPDGDPRPWLTNGFTFYGENLVNRGLCLKFNSDVRDWDAFVTRWDRSGRGPEAFVRQPSLDDPTWLSGARARVSQVARHLGPHRPLGYDLRDELSVTISANPFDFDFSPAALEGFRTWLRTRHPELADLNRAWATTFVRWEDVVPFSTDAIKARMVAGEAHPALPPDWSALARLKFDPARARNEPVRWNFAPWCDFRTYLDVSLARTLAALRDSARAADPETPVGIEGTQMPSAWGGYDLGRLGEVLDWVEPYDIGNAREILGDFMPGRPMLATFGERRFEPALRRLWHLRLLGDRGAIVWWSEDWFDWRSADLLPTAKALAVSPALREMRSATARLFDQARPVRDPIVIHYSQPSIQVAWLLESTTDGRTWPRRFSSFEAVHNRHARVRNGWLRLLQDLGWSPRFLASNRIEAGALMSEGVRVLVLPRSWALSDAELAAIRAFQAAGGTVLADGAAGWFDERGRLRPERPSPFSASAAPSLVSVIRVDRNSVEFMDEGSGRDGDRLETYGAARLRDGFPRRTERAFMTSVARMLEGAIAQRDRPVLRITVGDRIRVHRYRLDDGELVALERGAEYSMSEDLSQAGGNEILEQPVEFEARLTADREIRDAVSGVALGRTNRLSGELSPWRPAIFRLSP